jgi:hypothetical protein
LTVSGARGPAAGAGVASERLAKRRVAVAAANFMLMD